MKFPDMPYQRADVGAVVDTYNAEIARMRSASDADAVAACYDKLTDAYVEWSTMASLASTRNSIDTTDPFYKEENAYYDENAPVVEELRNRMWRALTESPHRTALEQRLGTLFFVNADLAVRGMNEQAVPFMQQINKLSTRYGDLIASAQIEFDGKQLNLPGLGYYMQLPDRATRKRAFEAKSQWFARNTDELDDIYDQLVKLRTDMAHTLGYQDFVELGYVLMGRNCYDATAVDGFRRQVKRDLVPYVAALQQRRAERIGISDPKAYDAGLYFKQGNPTPIGTPDEIFDNGGVMYGKLSEATREFYDFMRGGELFDCLTKPGKRGGGYCTTFPKYGTPFIFANFNGTTGDIDVLTHECGHALAAYLSRDMYPYDLRHPTMESCEIHSMGMEFFTAPYMDLFFGDRADDFRTMQQESALVFIPYGTMVDEYQHIIYSNPSLTPKERKAAWLDLERQYRPWLDFDGDAFYGSGGWWQQQMHIYEVPFYYIDYCLAQHVALQFNALRLKDASDAWQRYLALVRKGGSKTFVELVGEAGLQSPFVDGAFGLILG